MPPRRHVMPAAVDEQVQVQLPFHRAYPALRSLCGRRSAPPGERVVADRGAGQAACFVARSRHFAAKKADAGIARACAHFPAGAEFAGIFRYCAGERHRRIRNNIANSISYGRRFGLLAGCSAAYRLPCHALLAGKPQGTAGIRHPPCFAAPRLGEIPGCWQTVYAAILITRWRQRLLPPPLRRRAI
jgi:hypothetical protein